ncbi:MAG TPA: hypothetical protein VHR84_08745 [Terriglobales bacterium]|nr:hypothetical protein [Terriglobales bacterium]
MSRVSGNWRGTLLIFLCFAASVTAAREQVSSKPAYVVSFRKGSSQVAEALFEVALDNDHPRWKTRVTDKSGRELYVLSFEPQPDPSGDGRFLAWNAALADLRHPIYKNVLFPSVDPSQDTVKAWWFDPNPYAAVNLRTPRVVRVENFYCLFEVTDFALVNPTGPWIGSLKLKVRVTNTDPRSAVEEKH